MERGLWVSRSDFGHLAVTISYSTLRKCTLSPSGILTKPDLVDKGTEETVIDIAHNEIIHLKKGYMIVKCRGQKEITEKVSLTEAIEREKAYFKDHVYFQ